MRRNGLTNTQSANQNDPQTKIELRFRTLRTLWIALLLSIGMYYVFTLFVGRPENAQPNNTLFLVLVFIALSTTLISFPIKNKFTKHGRNRTASTICTTSVYAGVGAERGCGAAGSD